MKSAAALGSLRSALTFILPSLLLLSAPANATEIQGKWGLGVEVGTQLSSRAEASILRGISPRTAWILDVALSDNTSDRDRRSDFSTAAFDSTAPFDTTITSKAKSEGFSINTGPRFRRFLRPESAFSPYLDAFAHFVTSYSHGADRSGMVSDRRIGGAAGVALGVEYFSKRWPISLAVHTNVGTFTWTHSTSEARFQDSFRTSSQKLSGSDFSGSLAFSPVLQVRVYF
jgi:hypothetical protein